MMKNLIFFLYLHCGYVQLRDAVRSLLGRSRGVVVYYHRVGGCDTLSKPAAAFADDLDYFSRHYRLLTLAAFCEELRAGKPRRRRTLVITFDDGYRDNYLTAVPALLAAGAPATFFVSTGFVDSPRLFPHDARSAGSQTHENLRWDDLKEMQASGFEIGSHTVDHVNLAQLEDAELASQARQSLQALDSRLGARPRAFAFPWGKPADISPVAVSAVRSAGYYAASSAFGGCNSRRSDPFDIRRVDVGNGSLSRWAVRARVAGFDPDYWRMKLSPRPNRAIHP